MTHSILLVHGRSFKPPEADLKRLWLAALKFGIQRDLPQAKLTKFNDAKMEMVYYGHHSNEFLRARGQTYDAAPDMLDRNATLARLQQYKSHQFTKRQYKSLPGKSSFKELLADVGSVITSPLLLGDTLISAAAPDVAQYWNEDTQFGSEVRFEMVGPLRRAMKRGDRILVISHSLGTMVSYDTFWKFSHTGEYREDYSDKKIDLWITLGSPLGDETVKRNLKGASVSGVRRYPHNVTKWLNFAAEDDFVAHDEDVKNDYKAMLKDRLVSEIRDAEIYNLAVRNGKSNPHSSAGYLIHPAVTQAVGSWL